ncbi:hypothetical protein [Brachyspira pilosicoli]|uniref:hypothetical protein n=1 Tax=Brachyspira pilosicoli TaxID=52584 RepID=UPI001CA471D5|nr:hypothetical protein [Brachyspira pilosicoli]MBW5382871.1 hypothetical protein [Brachyspira pilosicoli]
MSGSTFWFAFLLVIIVVSAFTRYFILPKIFSKDSKKFKKYVEEAYNDLDTFYNSGNEHSKELIKNSIIGMAKEGNDIAIKFCEDKGWDIELKK